MASVGAGTGADAAMFKAAGCKVILIDPNEKLLEIAKGKLRHIEGVEADFHVGNGMNTGLPERSVDLIVVAQALHSLKHSYAADLMNTKQQRSGLGTEELARQHWETLLPDDHKSRVSVWYYNPDPHSPATQGLHQLLCDLCPKYAASQTPLLNAPFIRPQHFQPWMAEDSMQVSGLIALQKVELRAGQIGQWLSSYSFKPDSPEELARVVTSLETKWFNTFQKDGVVTIPYVGMVVQAPLRQDAFPMAKIDREISVRSPLEVEFHSHAEDPHSVPFAVTHAKMLAVISGVTASDAGHRPTGAARPALKTSTLKPTS